MANTPQPCRRCAHLYVNPMIPDDVIATTGPLYGRDCFADQPLKQHDRPDHDCPKFEEEDSPPPSLQEEQQKTPQKN